MSTYISGKEYVDKYPDTPKHMTNIDSPGIIDINFFLVESDSSFCKYPGDYIKITLSDVRDYNIASWSSQYNVPYRIYISDYDDWDRDKFFETEEDALAFLNIIKNAEVTCKNLMRLFKE